jgi:hypothetical protein
MSPSAPQYDIALSFAGEDRPQAEALAKALVARNVRVFYDFHEKAALWGKDLYQYLSDIYLKRARFCVVFVSKHYAAKLWTNHELKSAQARAFTERAEYILPVRLDETELPGVLPTHGYLRIPPETAETIADALAQKLGVTSGAPPAIVGTQIDSGAESGMRKPVDRYRLYEALCAMQSSQFAKATVYLGLPTDELPSDRLTPAERALVVLERMEQSGASGLKKLEDAIRKVAPHLLA